MHKTSWKPLVSVIVPVFDEARRVTHLLRGLMQQSLLDLEVVVIDDGSTDGSSEILDDLSDRYYPRIRVFHTANQGPLLARQTGIRESLGEYLAFCDCDDWPHQTMYETMLKTACRNASDAVVCAYKRLDCIRDQSSTRMTHFGNICLSLHDDPGISLAVNAAIWNKLFRKDVLADAYLISDKLQVGEDALLWLLALTRIKQISFVSEPLYTYTVHYGSLVQSISTEHINALFDGFRHARSHITEYASTMLPLCDVMALMHLGVSMPLRLALSIRRQSWTVINNIVWTLQHDFPLCLSHTYTSRKYNHTHHNINRNIAIAQGVFRAHLATPILQFIRSSSRWNLTSLPFQIVFRSLT